MEKENPRMELSKEEAREIYNKASRVIIESLILYESKKTEYAPNLDLINKTTASLREPVKILFENGEEDLARLLVKEFREAMKDISLNRYVTYHTD